MWGFIVQFCFYPREVHPGSSKFDGVIPKPLIAFAFMKPGSSPFLGRGVDHRLVKFAMSFR